MKSGGERALEALRFDGLESNFACVLPMGAPSASAYAAALAKLDAEIAAKPKAGRAWALKGKALSNLGRHEEARAALKRALALEPDGGAARAWLGGVELAAGRFREALEELDRAVALADGRAWGRFYRAVGLFASGREAEAGAELRLVDGSEAEPALAARAFEVLLLVRAGDYAAGMKALSPLLKSRPKAGWVFALRGRLHKGLGDNAACLRDLDKALKLSPASWIHLERSRVYEELGDILRALDDVDAAIALDGPSAALSLRRGHLQVCRRHYHLAIPDYTEALRLDPACREAVVERANVHCIREDFTSALADMELAERMSGGDPAVTLERLRMATHAGKTDGVAAEIEKAVRAKPALRSEADFLSGCLNLKLRDYAKAAASFDAASSSGDRKAAFYGVIARGLQETSGRVISPKTKKARLLICGLGIKPPYTANLQTLRAIAACDFIFNNLSEPEIASMLRLLSKEGQPTMFDVRGADSRWTKTIFREVRPGRTVGFVTRGHPLVCGGLACSLMEECKRQDVEFELFGSVSSMDTTSVENDDGRDGRHWGHQVLDYSSVYCDEFTLDVRLPAVIYFNATALYLTKREHLRFCENLEKLYSPRQKCWFYGRSFHVKPDLIELGELRGRHGKIDPSFTLLLPPKGSLA